MGTIENRFAVFGFQGYAQVAAISSTSEAAGYSASRMADTGLWNTWRSKNGDLSAVDVVIDLGVARNFCCVAFPGCNFTTSCLWQLRFGNDATFATFALDTGQVAVFDTSLPGLVDSSPGWGNIALFLKLDGSVFARYIRVRIWDVTNPAGYLRAAIALVEDGWQAEKGFAPEWTRDNQRFGDPGVEQVLRGHKITLKAASEEDEVAVASLNDSFKSVGRLLFVPQTWRPETWLREVTWCFFETYHSAVAVDQNGKFRKVEITFREVSA